MAEWLGGIGNKAQLRPAKPEAGAWPELGKIKLLYPPIRVEWVGVRGWRGVEMIRIKAVLSSTGLELELSLATNLAVKFGFQMSGLRSSDP